MDPQRPHEHDRDPPYTEYPLDPMTALFPNIYSSLCGDWTGGAGGPVLAEANTVQQAQFQHATTATASQSPVPKQQENFSDRRAETSVQQTLTGAPSLLDPLQERVDSAPNGANGDIANTHAQLHHAGLQANPRQPAFQASQTLSPSDSPRLQCRWEDCTRKTCFRREADLMRHIRTVHVSPNAYVCPERNCGRPFGRKDHLGQHRKRRH
ncbi:hypothetical protein ASPVEDRAFT_70037 [Aspergillus versicolor CBS 583.65]|uniref:C2H2-type domain-containing protein n=1 Tax=Aspergillus versicolor CBS 583.65 TaxID=1036611 RepID=A0A1L9PE22_ASPVE|nr:uncharacterized protein ASPVEDRAFT_70037 [Aspergillus versicolor CBS 583.65]OJI99705.1 hypothetical protein ASPVEDRAFT_70037 [Aspergillus versicolor CBS 583.65]